MTNKAKASPSQDGDKAPSAFNETDALKDLAEVKTLEEQKRADFQPCINFVQKAREKDISWAEIAEKMHQHGGPKLTGSEISTLFQEDGRADPSPRAERRAQRKTQKANQVQAGAAGQGIV